MANRQRLSLATEDYFLVGNEPGEAYTMDFSPQIVPPRAIDLLKGAGLVPVRSSVRPQSSPPSSTPYPMGRRSYGRGEVR